MRTFSLGLGFLGAVLGAVSVGASHPDPAYQRWDPPGYFTRDERKGFTQWVRRHASAPRTQGIAPVRPKQPPPRPIGGAIQELGDGTYLIAGGYLGRHKATRATWIYRPEPLERELRPTPPHPGGVWRQGPIMHFARSFASAELLADGRVLVAGGLDPSGNPQKTAEVLDVERGRWRRLPDMNHARAGAAIQRGTDARIFLIGGLETRTKPTATIESFQPLTDHFSEHPLVLPEAVSFPAVTRLMDGDFLISGGWTGTRASKQIVLVDWVGAPTSGRVVTTSHHPFARGNLRRVGTLAGARAGHRMRRIGEVVLIAGGFYGDPCRRSPLADPPEVWDPARCCRPSAFEPVGPLDPRYPRRLPVRVDATRNRFVREGTIPCPGSEKAPGPSWRGPEWFYPRDAWRPCEGREDPPPPLEVEPPQDRAWPFPATAKDPRPLGLPRGVGPLEEPWKGEPRDFPLWRRDRREKEWLPKLQAEGLDWVSPKQPDAMNQPTERLGPREVGPKPEHCEP